MAVRVADKDILRLLRANRAKRDRANASYATADAELTRLLAQGRDSHSVTAMADAAGISRETAHVRLRNATARKEKKNA